MLRATADDASMSARYRVGRALSPDTAVVWRAAIQPFIPEGPFRILDLGAGTCRFLPVLAGFSGGEIVCIDPSLDMLGAGASPRTFGNAVLRPGAASGFLYRMGVATSLDSRRVTTTSPIVRCWRWSSVAW